MKFQLLNFYHGNNYGMAQRKYSKFMLILIKKINSNSCVLEAYCCHLSAG